MVNANTVESKICCCGATQWAKVIAWLQIILNSFSLLLILLALIGVSQLKTVNDKWGEKTIEGAVLATFIVALFISVFGIVFGAVLLKGVDEKNAPYLKAWIMYTGLLIVWAVLGAALGRSGISIWVRIGQCIVEILVYGFGIWVVYNLKVEFESKVVITNVQRF